MSTDVLALLISLVIAVALAWLFPPHTGRVCGCCWVLMRHHWRDQYSCRLGCRQSEHDRDACVVHGRQ